MFISAPFNEDKGLYIWRPKKKLNLIPLQVLLTKKKSLRNKPLMLTILFKKVEE